MGTFFSQNEYRLFIELIKSKILNPELHFVLNEHDGQIYVDQEGQNRQVSLSLHNLARTCKQYEPTLWPKLISERLDLLERTIYQEEAHRFMSFDEIKSKMSVKIVPTTYGLPEAFRRTDIPETYSVLAIDFPDHIQYIFLHQ